MCLHVYTFVYFFVYNGLAPVVNKFNESRDILASNHKTLCVIVNIWDFIQSYHHALITESVDSISRDGPDTYLTLILHSIMVEYITHLYI